MKMNYKLQLRLPSFRQTTSLVGWTLIGGLIAVMGGMPHGTVLQSAEVETENDVQKPVEPAAVTPKKPRLKSQDMVDQRNWVFSPYKIKIWITTDNSPRFQTIQQDRLQQEMRSYVRNWVGAAWSIELEAPPDLIYTDILHNFDDVQMLDIAALYEPLPINRKDRLRSVKYGPKETPKPAVVDEETEEDSETQEEESEPAVFVPLQTLVSPNPLPQLDKIFAVSLKDRHGVFELKVAEFDTNARVRVLAATRQFRNLDELPEQLFSCIEQVFSPISRIQYNGMTDGKTASLEMRAVGLVPDIREPSPLMLQKGDVLRPVVRKNDRTTRAPVYDGVIEVIWTYMFVNHVISHEETSLGTIRSNGSARAEVISTFTMLRNPMAARRNTAQQKYGLLLRPTENSSLLKITAMGRDDYTLQGYNVFAKSPKLDPEDKSDMPTINIGQTDWRGGIEIDQDIFAGQGKTKLVVIYVKNGRRVLARLPIVPGYRPVEVASLPNDDYRLQYEAFVVGLQNSVLDYTVQRKVYEIRITHHVNEGEEKEARELLKALEKVPGLEEIDAILALREASLQDNVTIDSVTRPQIDRMFLQTRELINEYLQGNLVLKMTDLVNDKFGRPDPATSLP